MDDELKTQILRNLELSGAADENSVVVKPTVAKSPNNILSLNSGTPRISHHYVDRFKLLLSQPLALQPLNPFEIRCCLCHKVIAYPAWHYDVRYAVNWFHYFVCFDKSNGTKVTAKCYRR